MSKVVAVLDSGVGGISVLHEIANVLSNYKLIYIADSRYMPYGDKSSTFIKERCVKLVSFALKNKAEAIVIACNTATACALSYLRDLYPQIPIVGVEPALKPAVCASKKGIIGVLATERTLQSSRFIGLVKRYAQNTKVLTCACYGLAEQIENGELYNSKTYNLLSNYVNPLLNEGCDVLVLGCTHYPFLKPLLSELIPPNIKIIDTGKACAKHLIAVLNNNLNKSSQNNNNLLFTEFFTSLDAIKLEQILPNLWNLPFNSCSKLPTDLC